MDRDIVDIPEVFRRAFDEERWGGDGGGDKEPGGGEGGGRGSQRGWRPSRWVWLIVLIFLFLISVNWIVTTYTDWLWFGALDYRNVWLTSMAVRVGSFIIFFIVAAVVLILNWRVAFDAARKARRSGSLPLLELPGLKLILTGAGLFIAFIFGGAGGAQWESFLLFLNRQPFGADDPVFGIDIGFYLFELPVYHFLQGWLTPLLVVTLLGVAGLHLADSWISLQRGQARPQLTITPIFRRHVAILASFVLLLWAGGTWLNIYDLMYSPRGVAFGASYTDLNASLPALYVQLALMILLALAMAVNILRSMLRPLAIVGALWLAVTILAGNVYPAVLQRYSVEPNELSRERPYIQNNISFTRLAFGLDEVDVRPFGSVDELTEQDLAANQATLKNARLWDYRPLQQTYSQLQELRPYYEFSDVDIDRYQIEGEIRQVMLAGRELNKANVTAQWVNQKLEFTHGYGVVMNPVDKVTPQGRPEFFIKDLPPQSTIDLEVTRPEIYYGETMNDAVFVGSGLDEFDFPSGTQNTYSSYAGEGGVLLSNLLRRVAFAARLGETNLLLSQYITDETRVMIHRAIRERVQQITPFLTLDDDPYIVVADGRLVWMLDGYTISRHFPYSSPTEQGFNYIRNAVKITVDAYNGNVNYYLIESDDPIIQAYSQAFPNLFQPMDKMPAVMREHIRYPEDLFIVQTRQYLKYHMSDVQVFYNQEDLWQIPLEIFDSDEQLIEPYYVIMSLPNQEETEFLLIQPYTPAGKNNMISWIAARNDEPNYGQLVVYELPKQELVFGPIQVEARIDQDPQISSQISLWNQRGSRVIRGNLIVIPMGNSFLYIEPLYLLAETSELPELKRIIVASGDQISMRETLEEALSALLEDAPSVVDLVAEPPVTGDDSGEEPAEPPTTTEVAPLDANVLELVQSANAHFEAAEAAQRSGDWSTYGRELEALQMDLERLSQLTAE